MTRAGGELHLEAVAQVVVELLERLDHEVVHRKPDRAAPVRVAAEEAAFRFGGLVVDAVLLAVQDHATGLTGMKSREAADAVGRKELGLVEQHRENSAEALLV